MSPAVILGAGGGFLVMLLMALGQPAASESAGAATGLLFIAGLAGASAMILPGVSGGYLLLLLGQYVPILSAVHDFKEALTASPRDWPLAFEALKVGVPVGIGVVLGVVGVSNLLRFLLDRYRKATLGALLGLLLGAVVGLWPFQRALPPEPGQSLRGVEVTAENLDTFEPEDWATERFRPSGAEVASALGLILAGFLATQAIGRLGRKPNNL